MSLAEPAPVQPVDTQAWPLSGLRNSPLELKLSEPTRKNVCGSLGEAHKWDARKKVGKPELDGTHDMPPFVERRTPA